MTNNDNMRRLIEQVLLRNDASDPDNFYSSDSFVPSGHVTVKLVEVMCAIMSIKQYIAVKNWKNFCMKSFLKALSSHEMYLRYVMYTCDIDIGFLDNVFETIVRVCAIVIMYTSLTIDETGVNFSELTADIIMVFYKRFLKRSFYRQGGFVRFQEYLDEEYDTVVWHIKHKTNYYDLPKEDRECFADNWYENLEKLFGIVPYVIETDTHEDVVKNRRCHKLAEEVLSTTKIKLPDLPSSDELTIRIQKRAAKSEKSEMPKVYDSKRGTTENILQPSSNYQAIDSLEDEANIAWCDEIVRKVTMYNNSKRSDPNDANNQIQKEASKILEHLEDTIKSLIEIL